MQPPSRAALALLSILLTSSVVSATPETRVLELLPSTAVLEVGTGSAAPVVWFHPHETGGTTLFFGDAAAAVVLPRVTLAPGGVLERSAPHAIALPDLAWAGELGAAVAEAMPAPRLERTGSSSGS